MTNIEVAFWLNLWLVLAMYAFLISAISFGLYSVWKCFKGGRQ